MRGRARRLWEIEKAVRRAALKHCRAFNGANPEVVVVPHEAGFSRAPPPREPPPGLLDARRAANPREQPEANAGRDLTYG